MKKIKDKMESWQVQYIQDNFTNLKKNIICSPSLCAELFSKEAISEDEYGNLLAKNNSSDQALYLLGLIVKKANGYKKLLSTLHEFTQTLAEEILSIGVLYNLKIKISGRILRLTNFLNDKEEMTQLYRSKINGLHVCLIKYLENGEPIRILKRKMPIQPSYYIPRMLCKRLCINSEIFKQPCPDVFVVSGINWLMLKKLAGNKTIDYSRQQWDKITADIIILEAEGMQRFWSNIQKKTKSPIHLISYDKHTHKFILQESKGISDIIHRYIEANKEDHAVTIKEKKFMSDIINERGKGACICDLPGMGKTILLENLARMERKKRRSVVAIVKLQDFTQTALQFSQDKNPIESLTKYLSASTSGLPAYVLRKILELKKTQIDLFFDGFDEVEEKYLKWTKRCLQLLISHDHIRVFVTSRPHMRQELEHTLGVIAYDILPFNEKNQINFFTKYWSNKNPQEDSLKLAEYAKRTCLQEFCAKIPQDEQDIAGIPIICLLIADTFADQACRFARGNIQSTENWISVGNSMFDIYKNYIDTKFANKKNSAQKTLCEIKKHKEEHYRLALTQMFPGYAQKLTKDVSTKNEDLDKNVWSYGLVHPKNKSEGKTQQFIHRTIAEFLIADYIVSQIVRLDEDDQINPHSRDMAREKMNFFMDFFGFLFQNVFTSQKVYKFGHMFLCVYKSRFPQFYLSKFTSSTVIYFMEHQLKDKTLSENVGNLVYQYLTSANIHIDIIQLMECCSHQNLEKVFGFIELIVKSRSRKENISRDSLCKIVIGIFEFSNAAFVKQFVQFVNSYFDFPLTEIAHVCKRNGWATPLQYVCIRRFYDLLDYFAEECGSIEEQCLLHHCVEHHISDVKNTEIRIQMMEMLIDMNPNLIHERPIDKSTALLHVKSSSRFMKFLVDKGSDVFEVTMDEITLGHRCVHFSQSTDEFKEAILFLVNECKGTRLLKIKNWEGNTPIHSALLECDKLPISLLKYLLKKSGMDVNEINGKGDNLLSVAIRGNQSVEILRFLISLGANYNVINNDESNLLHLAAEVGNVEGVRLLMRLGLNSKQRNRIGNSPVNCANDTCCYGTLYICNHKKIVKMLNVNPYFKYIYYFLVCSKYFVFCGFMYLLYVAIM